MEKSELIKGILKLGIELDKTHGSGSIMIVDEMEQLVDQYTKQLGITAVVQAKPEKVCENSDHDKRMLEDGYCGWCLTFILKE